MTILHICAKCCVELKVKENGVLLAKMSSIGPMECSLIDLWECPVCQAQVVAGQERAGLSKGAEASKAFIREARAMGKRVIEYWLNETERNRGVVA